MNLSRRELLQAFAAVAALWPLRAISATAAADAEGNFRFVYANPQLRAEFRKFLVNVFHLYPEDDLHELIRLTSMAHGTDESTYRALQEELGEIKPFLADLTYALPALKKQKKEMAAQTATLLATNDRLEGYLEIGSTGRYLDALEETLRIRGDRFFVSNIEPSYSPVDMLDRGQLPKAGAFIPLADYKMNLSGTIPPNSLDLVTVYIGFHHCPIPLRESFFASIREAMSAEGRLIVRDHNVHNEQMWHLVALAHDVFNMGTKETWSFNADERRHFYPLTELHAMLTKAGFKTDGRRLVQDGDPTMNTLMLYRKA